MVVRKVQNRSTVKRIAIDIAAIGLIVSSPFLGVLPGPGGVPIFLAGMGLLATNHEWAQKILQDMERHRHGLAKNFFDNPRISLATDLIGIALIAGAIYIGLTTDSLLFRGLAIGTISTTFLVLLSNRQRLERIKAHFSNKQ